MQLMTRRSNAFTAVYCESIVVGLDDQLGVDRQRQVWLR